MKKLLFFVLTALVMFSCKEKQPPADLPSEDTATTTTDIDSSKITCQQIQISLCTAQDWCDDPDIPEYHRIYKGRFQQYQLDRWGSITNPAPKVINWSQIASVIGNHECYEKFIKFDFTRNSNNNSTIAPVKVNCFHSDSSCYSIPLLKSIYQRLKPKNNNFECSIAKINNKEMVIFKIIDKDNEEWHFDVSDFPKRVNAKYQKAMLDCNE